jgi:hypothetical protein
VVKVIVLRTAEEEDVLRPSARRLFGTHSIDGCPSEWLKERMASDEGRNRDGWMEDAEGRHTGSCSLSAGYQRREKEQ